MSHSFSASNKLTQVLNNAATTLAVRLGTDLPQLQPSGFIQVQFPQRDITKFLTHDSIGAAGAGTLLTAHGYISIDDQIMWFDGITNIGGLGQFKVYKRRINLSSVISHVYNSPIQMRVTRQHFLQMQGFLSSISRAFSTSGNAIIDLSNSSYGLQYVGSQYNVGNIMWNSMTAAIQNLGTQWYDDGFNLFPKNNKGVTASYLSIGGNTTVNSLSRTSLSILGLRKDLNWDSGYNTLFSNSASWGSMALPTSRNWDNSYNALTSYSANWQTSYSWGSHTARRYLKNDRSVSVTSNWNVDGTNTLYIDKTNNRIGINTVTPAQPLHIDGRGSSFGLISSTSNSMYLYFGIDSSATFLGLTGQLSQLKSGNSLAVGTWATNPIFIGTNNVARLTIAGDTGYVGIATTSPSGALHVVGSVFMPSLKSGTAQADAGAAAGELWINTLYS